MIGLAIGVAIAVLIIYFVDERERHQAIIDEADDDKEDYL